MNEPSLASLFAAIADRATLIPSIRQRALAGNWVLHLQAGEETFALANRHGDIRLEAPGAAADASLKASPGDWRQLFGERRRPGYQTLYGMLMKGRLRVSGNMVLFNQYLFLLELLFGTLPPGDAEPQPARPPRLEAITGRYINLVHEGQALRIYFEEAGSGIPLLCLHTAGADGRQYRALLNDERITRDFRVIAFDLPRHGKSAPPEGFIRSPYLLTTEAYVALVMAMIEALQLERPVVMGCSIGGRAVLHLALRHPDRFRALIGLQSALYADAGGDFESSAIASTLFRPDLNSQELAAASVAGIMAPDSPGRDRWETLWYYMQGGPGVFLGDLHYYFVDGDLRNGLAAGIDTERCPVYLLTGEFDLSATPEMTAEVAREIRATHFEVMKDLGHFPMSENPALFLQYLLPVLDRISGQR